MRMRVKLSKWCQKRGEALFLIKNLAEFEVETKVFHLSPLSDLYECEDIFIIFKINEFQIVQDVIMETGLHKIIRNFFL